MVERRPTATELSGAYAYAEGYASVALDDPEASVDEFVILLRAILCDLAEPMEVKFRLGSVWARYNILVGAAYD
jgi:hypothetical protein